jgi:Suppressor of fused protein (SUFU)
MPTMQPESWQSMNIASHLEKHLGPIEQGWSSDSLPGIQVCLFRDQPDDGLITLTTLGLSIHVLDMPGGRSVRQELTLVVPDEAPVQGSTKLLLHVVEGVLQKHQALLRGEVLSLGARIDVNSAASALYVSIPAVFADQFATFHGTAPPTVIAWLFPVLPAEERFIANSGWSAFEGRLEAADPDLFDILRPSVV